MAEPFHSIHFNVAGETDTAVESAGARPLPMRAGPARTASSSFASEEAAARFYLSNVFQRDARPALRGLSAPDRPEVVPDLQLRDSRGSELTGTSVVRFVQTKSNIPIFGSRAVVEMDRNKELLGVDAELAEVEGVSPIAQLSPADALKRIADAAGVKASELSSANEFKLTFFHDDDKDRWHLCWYFRNVPAAPPGFSEDLDSHGIGHSIARHHPEVDYLIDAHSGEILLYWSSSPTALAKCEGIDEDGVARKFFGNLTATGTFELSDSLRRIRTIDFGGGDIENAPPPTAAIDNGNASNKFVGFESAVSAHYNAMLVMDFLKSVLKRDGVDDKGMELISYINCTYPRDQAPPEWHNAAWWKRQMWYGQSKEADGRMRSFARHLDIIAHELAHGLTEFTADLAYVRQSGALNESFSDIFGVIIKNWDWTQPETGGDVADWNWEIGPGLRPGGMPLRDMSDPTRTGDPAHMSQYLTTTRDNGGVHTNSNIHNKAAFNVLTRKDAGGNAVFTPADVAILYYLTLGRLDRLATFTQVKKTLLNIAGIYFAGDPTRADRLAAISEAYDDVGIN